MSFFKDALAMFKKRDLPFIESYKESEGVYTFLFEKEQDLHWVAGQHGLFTITHKKVKNKTRPFTIASAPSEDVVRLTMRISDNPSEFKQAMLELKKGMTINLTGPIGGLNLDHSSPTLLIAGGIGITPFRAILKQIESEGKTYNETIHLVYLDSSRTFIFRDEIDAIANKASVKVTYLESRDDLYEEINTFTTSNKDSVKYIIAGPDSMVKSIVGFLKDKQIPKKHITKDGFYGY